MLDLHDHRRELERSLAESFGYDLSKARMEGDITIAPDGKTYVWAKTKTGSTTQYSWHVLNKNKVVRGKGYNGKHGIAALSDMFTDINKACNDTSKMMLKRTPNNNWRLFYDNMDSGLSIAGDTFTVSELEQDNICYQSNNVVDNFERVKDYMEFNSPDDVYFFQIIKRWKDNKDKPGADAWKAQGRINGSYHAGAEYLQYYLVHSYQELKALQPTIIKQCQYNNARAYMSINARNQAQTDAYMAKFKQRINNPNDPRYKNAEAILYGMPKSGDNWKNERFKVLLDIDTTRDAKTTLPNGKSVNIWDETERRLNDAGVKVAMKYETPSGGLHVILNNKNNRNLASFYKGLSDFDGGRNLGKQATVHPSEDTKMVLYSNVETAGY